MQQWEYRSALMQGATSDWNRVRTWRLRRIDDQELPDWRKAEIYSSIIAFCNEMGEEGWELISMDGGSKNTSVELYFKRPRMDETL
jgi:hypothetical protein